ENPLLMGIGQRFGHLHAYLGHAPAILPLRQAGELRSRVSSSGRGADAGAGRHGSAERGARSTWRFALRALRSALHFLEAAGQKTLCDAEGELAAAVLVFDRWAALAAAQPPYLLQHGIQALTLDKLHGVVVNPLALADAEHRHNVAMMQLGGSPCLAAEAFQVRRIH